ncbi:hypothetical protein [Roseateles terrae]|uniref:Uncharacterized protein n=1 Tax=Roseateles terrae TaxID=431060 RepID=A0ABR6GYG9_9BURK|nr:hypothetical protein [Roseateles terrae]MBB3197168.1 hypothetical protein [Roseateles terrae]
MCSMLIRMNRCLAVLSLIPALASASELPTPASAAPQAAASESSTTARVYDGYDAFFLTLPSRLFDEADKRPHKVVGMNEPAGDFWTWTSAGKAHVLEMREADALVDGRRLRAARATRFPGEFTAPALGSTARVYANDIAVCIEGVPGSASGTSVRHIQVSLILQPYSPKARRYELAGLFAGCLSLTRVPEGIGFLRGAYRWPEGAPSPLGVTMEQWRLQGATFVRTSQTWSMTFTEPDNVYRFTSP